MEEESRETLKIGVALVLLGVLVGIVISTTFIANSMRNKASEKIGKLQAESEEGQLKDLNGKVTDLSLASAYAIINGHRESIGKITCKLNQYHSDGTTKEYEDSESIQCLNGHLHGRCKFVVQYNYDTTAYDVEIHKENCDDPINDCSCD